MGQLITFNTVSKWNGIKAHSSSECFKLKHVSSSDFQFKPESLITEKVLISFTDEET